VTAARWIPAEWPAPAGIIAGTTLRDSGFELPAEPQLLQQVHGTRVVKLGTGDFAGGPPEADAVIADRPGDICVVRIADCLPILLCARDGSEIAAIHAGWRGLAAGVVETTLAALSTPADDLLAWFGPAISQAAFEVGAEVRERFGAWGEIEGLFVPNDRGRLQADLYGLARARLRAAGVSGIFGGGLCTYADAERFYSYRRDAATGRMLSFVFRESP
jgi:YfiH family protein